MNETAQQVERFREVMGALREQIGRVIVGHEQVVEGTLQCIFAGGHALLEGVPGLGKTLLVRTLGQVLSLQFSRIQFTPDLMPADITGTNLLVEDEEGRRRFQFQPGPVFANIVLADEVNRATPKTQSALLEAMQEHAVTVAGVRYTLPEPFFVLATQNPIEMEGTYPLPEAQLDRFLFKLLVYPPSVEQLNAIIDRTTGAETPQVETVADGETVVWMQRLARQVPLAEPVRDFASQLVHFTHPEVDGAPNAVKRYVRYGSSPRGAQALVQTAKVRALSQGRYNVAIEDIEAVAYPALRHRILLNFEAEAQGVTPEQVIDAVLGHVRGRSEVKLPLVSEKGGV
ncbi:MAG: AAA family ATPase [Armatimonadetes bacterium]|nr:AAA family ATPase [Armatimonadota bacterium]